jgi:hypothetical protein
MFRNFRVGFRDAPEFRRTENSVALISVAPKTRRTKVRNSDTYYWCSHRFTVQHGRKEGPVSSPGFSDLNSSRQSQQDLGFGG